jgi:hypothetical protein
MSQARSFNGKCGVSRESPNRPLVIDDANRNSSTAETANNAQTVKVTTDDDGSQAAVVLALLYEFGGV